MSNLFKRHTPLFDNPTTFQDLNPGDCCVDDVFLSDATIALNGAVWELTLTLNDGTTYVVPFPTEFTDDIRVASFTRHPDALTDPAFVNTIRIVLTDSTIFDLDLSFLAGGGGGGEDLAATLVLGNITGGTDVITSDGDKIVPANGNVILDLRATGVNDFWFLGNDASGGAFTGPFGSMVYGDGTTTALLFDVVRYGVVVDTNSAFIGAVDPSSPAAYSNILPGRTSAVNEATLTLPTDTIEGSLTIIQNSVSNRSFRSVAGTTTAVSINSGSGGPNSTVINLGVTNSVAIGGEGLTVKTDNTLYVNQISLQPSGNTFDGVLAPIGLTADRAWGMQDASGTVAFLTDIPGSYTEDLDSALPSITRVFAGGRTTFTITHSLNTLDVKPQVYRLSDGRTIDWRIERTGVNTIEASRAGNVADGLFRIII